MYHNLLDKDRPFGMVFATVAIPISDWWGGSHAIRKQKLQVKAAEYSRQNANELLLVQMRKLWNELEESYKQVKLSEESIATAEENVRLNTDYYKAGTVTLSDLLDAQSLLQQSRDQYTGDYTAYLIKTYGIFTGDRALIYFFFPYICLLTNNKTRSDDELRQLSLHSDPCRGRRRQVDHGYL
mgnify:CR=1 FL=1